MRFLQQHSLLWCPCVEKPEAKTVNSKLFPPQVWGKAHGQGSWDLLAGVVGTCVSWGLRWNMKNSQDRQGKWVVGINRKLPPVFTCSWEDTSGPGEHFQSPLAGCHALTLSQSGESLVTPELSLWWSLTWTCFVCWVSPGPASARGSPFPPWFLFQKASWADWGFWPHLAPFHEKSPRCLGWRSWVHSGRSRPQDQTSFSNECYCWRAAVLIFLCIGHCFARCSLAHNSKEHNSLGDLATSSIQRFL